MTAGPAEEGDPQLSLPGFARAEVRRVAPPPVRKPVETAATDPVAQVLVDLPLAHLDRPFDYAVPVTMADTAVPGARVKVRFAGQDVDGFVIARTAESDHPGRLQPLRRVVSAEPVLAAEIADLVGEVAARYAGTRSDVLRLAVPARHATTEKATSPEFTAPTARPDPAAWSAYQGGPGLLAAIGGAPDAGEPIRAVWTAGPGDDWSTLLAARAIENTLYVAAADHTPPIGVGHSMVVDPMGVVLAGLGETTGVAVAEASAERVSEVRRRNPALQLRRYRVEPID